MQIVWISWFTDSVALWARQDERRYLLTPPMRTTPGPPDLFASDPPSDPHQISSDPEPDADDWDEGADAEAVTLPLDDVDWAAVNDEVEEAMNDSDADDDEEGEGDADAGSVRSGMEDEDEWSEESLGSARCVVLLSRPYARLADRMCRPACHRHRAQNASGYAA